MTTITSTSGRLHSEFVRLLFLQTHRETDRFFAVSGFQFPNLTVVSSTSSSKTGLTWFSLNRHLLVTLNLDGAPIISKLHTQPSQSQTYRLLTSSLSLGVPVPRTTQCVRDV